MNSINKSSVGDDKPNIIKLVGNLDPTILVDSVDISEDVERHFRVDIQKLGLTKYKEGPTPSSPNTELSGEGNDKVWESTVVMLYIHRFRRTGGGSLDSKIQRCYYFDEISAKLLGDILRIGKQVVLVRADGHMEICVHIDVRW
jgi:hypothetical protein